MKIGDYYDLEENIKSIVSKKKRMDGKISISQKKILNG